MYEMVCYTVMLMNESYYVTADLGFKGPLPFICFRMFVIITATTYVYETTMKLAQVTLKVLSPCAAPASLIDPCSRSRSHLQPRPSANA